MAAVTMSARAVLVLSTGALVVLTSAATVLLALSAASIVGSAASLSPLPSAAGVRAPGSEVVMLPGAIVDLDHSVLRPGASTVAAAGPRRDVDLRPVVTGFRVVGVTWTLGPVAAARPKPEPAFGYPVGAVLAATAPLALPRAGQVKSALVKSEPSAGPSVSAQRDRVERVQADREKAGREKADRVKGNSLTEKTDPGVNKRTTRRSRAG